jgi:hypothetical protein
VELKHRVACAECPWRKEAPAGWLGGHSAEFYADALALNEAPACHMSDFGPFNPQTAFCAGALAVAKNSAISLHHAAGDADSAKQEILRRDDCFANVRDFYRHHTGEEYQIPLLRRLNAKNGSNQ